MTSEAPASAAGTTCRAALATATERLAAAGVPNARGDAAVLLSAATGLDRGALLAEPDRVLSGDAAAGFAAMVAERAARRPVARILGTREFWSLPLAVSDATLDPRPDTETLVDAALDTVTDRAAPLRVLDLGTGSGCLLLALLSELPNARGVGVDNCPAAAVTARANARRLGLGDRARILVGDWTAPLIGRFDLIVSNPPYLSHADFATVAPEVARHDPRAALDGGADGLAAYRALLAGLHERVAPGARIVLEVGSGQAEPVSDLIGRHGFEVVRRGRDLSGIDRCLVAAVAASEGG
jgi:release factor glutamine methyltransferase